MRHVWNLTRLLLRYWFTNWPGSRSITRLCEDELDLEFPSSEVELPALSLAEALRLEHGVLGLSTGEHVMSFYRSRLTTQGILGSWDLVNQPNGRQVHVASLVVVHQSPPTAKGYHFVTLEDETDLLDVIIRPKVYERYRALLRNVPLLIIEGVVQHQDGVVNLLAGRIRGLLSDNQS